MSLSAGQVRLSGSRRRVLAASLAALGVLGVAAPSAVAADRPASAAAKVVRVSGGAGTVLTENFPGFVGDAVHFEVDAQVGAGVDPRGAKGHFHVTHHRKDGTLLAEFEGDVTCLMAGGRDAIATGVVTGFAGPGLPGIQPVGSKVSITVQDNGRHGDRLGWVWGFFGAPVSDCQGVVPFIAMRSGDFSVRG